MSARLPPGQRRGGVRIAVTYNDNAVLYYPVGEWWRIDNASRCIVIRHNESREYVPLDQVRSFAVEPMPDESTVIP